LPYFVPVFFSQTVTTAVHVDWPLFESSQQEANVAQLVEEAQWEGSKVKVHLFISIYIYLLDRIRMD